MKQDRLIRQAVKIWSILALVNILGFIDYNADSDSVSQAVGTGMLLWITVVLQILATVHLAIVISLYFFQDRS